MAKHIGNDELHLLGGGMRVSIDETGKRMCNGCGDDFCSHWVGITFGNKFYCTTCQWRAVKWADKQSKRIGPGRALWILFFAVNLAFYVAAGISPDFRDAVGAKVAEILHIERVE